MNISAALAGDDDDDRSIMDKIMSTIGLKKPGDEPDITYTERSPLVVPPSRDLPAPIQTAAPPSPDWPKDKDVKRRKEIKAKKKAPIKTWDFTEDARPLRPDELAAGRRPGQDEGKAAPNHGDSALGNVRQDQTGSKKSIFTFDWFKKEEYATFTGEPPRADLTDPPVGYRTPSADQPYGIGPDRTRTKSKTIGERMETETGH
jgi:hypothetical protein